jgi:internalin A
LQRLEVLRISNNSVKEFDVSYIAQIQSLKELAITGDGEGIINIDRLKNLVNLEKLLISTYNSLDLSWITHLQNLRILDIERCAIDDVSPLLELPNLVSVDVSKSWVKDITPLFESKSIKNILGPPVLSEGEDLSQLLKERGIQYTVITNDR